MKILFLSHYFPPEVNAPATRTFEHCRQWVRQGHQVTVIAAAPNHPRGRVFPGYKNSLYSEEFHEGIRLIRVWTYITPNEGFVKRTLGYVSFMLSCIIASLFVGKHNLVISTTPQFFNGLAGYFVSHLQRCKWVLEVRDLWPESIVAVGAISNPKIIRFLESIESFCYRKADQIIAVTKSFKKHIAERGACPEKIDVIYNGVDLKLFEQDALCHKSSIAKELAIDSYAPNHFIAAYVGTHGMAHKLDTILEAAEILRNHPNIRFLMAGDGSERQRLQAIKMERQLDNIIMLDQLPKHQMPKLWQLVDASLVLLKRCDLFKTVIPSKIFESMAMSKPIVLGVEGEVAEIIEQSRSGICIEPENAVQLAKAVLDLHDNTNPEFGQNGLEFVTREFDRQELALQFLCILERVNSNSGTPFSGTSTFPSTKARSI